jgi:hypothetical protein
VSAYGFFEAVGAFFACAFLAGDAAGFFGGVFAAPGFELMVLVARDAGFLLDAALVDGAFVPAAFVFVAGGTEPVVPPAGVTVRLAAASCAAAQASVESILLAGSVPDLTNRMMGSQSHCLLDVSSAECPLRQCRTSDA